MQESTYRVVFLFTLCDLTAMSWLYNIKLPHNIDMHCMRKPFMNVKGLTCSSDAQGYRVYRLIDLCIECH